MIGKVFNRIRLIQRHMTSNINQLSPIRDSFNYFFLDDFLTKEEQDIRKKFREFLILNVKKQMISFIQKSEVPKDLIKKMVTEFPGLGYYGASYSHILQALLTIETYRIDASLSIAFGVSILAANTIYFLGSDDQKEKFIPAILKGDMFGCFALTEPESGSDIAKKMATSAKPVEGGYIVNGVKIWVGNASFADVMILWARNTNNNLVQGFIVEKGMNGVRTEVLKTKLSARGVHNAKIIFENVFIPEANKLPLANDFTKGAGILLVLSRLGVAYTSVGTSMAAYDHAIEYALKRKQFGKPIAGFQLTQEKLYRIMSNTQGMLFMCLRLSDFVNDLKLTPGMASMAKAWCSKMARENIRLAREIMGGNGILIENFVMSALLDVESQYTYEGAYDINNLLLGNELTGMNGIV